MYKIFVFHTPHLKGIFKYVKSLQIVFWFGGYVSDSGVINASAQ